jgi:hypothetical protein
MVLKGTGEGWEGDAAMAEQEGGRQADQRNSAG